MRQRNSYPKPFTPGRPGTPPARLLGGQCRLEPRNQRQRRPQMAKVSEYLRSAMRTLPVHQQLPEKRRRELIGIGEMLASLRR
ncbi:hypothetical protein FQZ97_459360 [compost metagenome]